MSLDAKGRKYALGLQGFGRGSVEEYCSSLQQHALRAVAQGQVEVVDDDEYCFALIAVDVGQQLHNFELVGDIEVGCRFVEQEVGRLLCQCTCYHHALQFAAAHLAWQRQPQMPCVGLFHALLHDVPVMLRLVLKVPLIRVAPHKDGFEGRKFDIGLRMLLYARYSLCQLACGVVAGRFAVDNYFAMCGVYQVGYAPQQGRLAASVGPHDGTKRAVRDG